MRGVVDPTMWAFDWSFISSLHVLLQGDKIDELLFPGGVILPFFGLWLGTSHIADG